MTAGSSCKFPPCLSHHTVRDILQTVRLSLNVTRVQPTNGHPEIDTAQGRFESNITSEFMIEDTEDEEFEQIHRTVIAAAKI